MGCQNCDKMRGALLTNIGQTASPIPGRFGVIKPVRENGNRWLSIVTEEFACRHALSVQLGGSVKSHLKQRLLLHQSYQRLLPSGITSFEFTTHHLNCLRFMVRYRLGCCFIWWVIVAKLFKPFTQWNALV